MGAFEFFTEPAVRDGAVSFMWRWRRKQLSGPAVESTRCFSQFRECVDDAREHGFRDDQLPCGTGPVDLIRSAIGD